MKKAAIYTLWFVFAVVGCSLFKGRNAKKDEVVLYHISGQPVRATDYKPHKKYISDYEIIKAFKLTAGDTAMLSKSLSSDSLRIKGDNHRSCEFMPAYALKWPSGKVVLVSLSPCSKIQIINKATDPAIVNDLRDHNDLESWLVKRDTTTSK